MGRIAHKNDILLQDFHQAVEMLVDVSPSEVKKSLKEEWKSIQMNGKITVTNPLDIYSCTRLIAVKKIRAKLSFITDKAEKLGLLAKPRRTRVEAWGLVRKPTTNG